MFDVLFMLIHLEVWFISITVLFVLSYITFIYFCLFSINLFLPIKFHLFNSMVFIFLISINFYSFDASIRFHLCCSVLGLIAITCHESWLVWIHRHSVFLIMLHCHSFRLFYSFLFVCIACFISFSSCTFHDFWLILICWFIFTYVLYCWFNFIEFHAF